MTSQGEPVVGELEYSRLCAIMGCGAVTERGSAVDHRTRVVTLILVMTVVAVGAVGIALAVLYKVALGEQRARLVEIAQSRARLMEAVARFDAEHSAADVPGGAFAATISQVREAHEQFRGFGKTGEFTLARREGDQIVFLLSHRHADLSDPQPVAFSSQLAEPMRRALSGRSGTLIGLDYRGSRVLAAYEPVDVLDLGIVAKIDLSEVRAPFIRAAFLAGGGAALLIFLGTLLFLRLVNPMVRRLEESNERFRTVIEQAADAVFLVRPDGRFVDVNQRACDALGYTREELLSLTVSDIDPVYPQDAFDEFRRNMVPGVAVTIEAVHRRKDGTTFPVEIRTGLIELLEKPMLLSLARDVTERKRAEGELRAAHEQLEQRVAERTRELAEANESLRDEIAERLRAEQGLLGSERQLRTLASQLAFAEERERRRIAADLHDRIGQALAVSKIKLGQLLEAAGDTELEAPLREVRELVDQTVGDTRSLTFDLSPPVLYELGLEAAIEWLAERIRDRHGLDVVVERDGAPLQTSDDIGGLVFRAVRELLLNVVKHAGADTARIALHGDRRKVRISVEDNGDGFDLSKARTAGDGEGGFGLYSIRQLVEHLGGRLDITSEPGQGTRATLEVPVGLG